jgi:hypothetical protein
MPKSKISLKERKQLHISGINALNECGMRFMFRYVEGVKRKPDAFLIKGTGVDKAVGSNLDNKIEKGVLLEEDAVCTIARDTIAERAKEEGIVFDEESGAQNVGEVQDSAVRLVTLHHRHVAPTLRPVRVARKFSINMDAFLRTRSKQARDEAARLFDDGNKYAAKLKELEATALYNAGREGWDFAGEQDIVEEYTDAPESQERASSDANASGEPSTRLVVRDTKTSGKSPNATAAHDSEQLTGYAVASKVLDGRLPDKMMLDFLVETPKTHKLYPVIRDTYRTMDDVAVFLNRFANAVHAIKSGIFVPTKPDDWRCSQKWCGYFNICPYAKRPKLVQIAAAQGEQA